jgi:creatinine amidohydrolase
MAARLVAVEHSEVVSAAAFYLTSPEGLAEIEAIRESERGGMAHACELETSIYLAIDPDAVDMALAVDEESYPNTEHAWFDWTDGSLRMMPWWSSFSRTGVQGRPTLATADKGRRLLDAAVHECVAYVRELREIPVPERRAPEPPR